MNRGFTLIETLVAVLLLATAIAGPLTIASRGLTTALIAKDQVTAFYLAQDAVEYVRFVRDSNRLSSQAWLAGLDGSADGGIVTPDGGANCTGTFGCYFDSTRNNSINASTNIGSCTDSTCTAAILFYNVSTAQFTYDSSQTKTIYKRIITLAAPTTCGSSPCDEQVLTVVVSWSDTAGITRNVTVHENIYNWQP